MAEGSALPYDLTLNAATPAQAAPATIANSDVIAWRTTLANTLTSGTGSIILDADSKKLTVVVQWDDSRAKGGRSNEQYKVETRL